GAAITYSNELKTRLAGVPAGMIAEHGAVSEPVARAMAEGVRHALGSDWGVGITGIAGPGGGSEAKPVGTVHLAVAGPRAGEVEHRHVRLPGDRKRVRRFATQIVLEMLGRRLIAEGSGRA
ncbi:MAG: competence/damage-inducible protein A, partial [Acidobacteria bacterium]